MLKPLPKRKYTFRRKRALLVKNWSESKQEKFKAFYKNNGWEATAKKFKLLNGKKLHKFLTLRIARYLNVTVKKSVTTKLRAAGMIGKTTSTPKIDKIIKANYLIVASKPLAKMCNKSTTFLKKRLEQLGLKIPRKILNQRIKDSRIKEGAEPPNKGKTWNEYMSKEGQKRSRTTTFKKGGTPPNTLYDGAITLRHNHKERGSKPYYWIRMGLANWKMLHVWLWEKEKGPVPAGSIIVFKNGDTKKVVIGNLECITRQENLDRNRNYEKAGRSLAAYHASGQISDKHVALYLAPRKEMAWLRQLYIEDKQLLEVKRKQLMLRKELKKLKSKK